MDIAQPAAPTVGSLDPVASQVTTQNAEPNAPQAETPAGTEQPAKAVEETAEQKAASEETQSQDGEQPKTWKEKRQERNRDRWQAFKQAKEVLPARLESLEKEVARLRGTAPPDFSQIVDPNEELAERTAWKVQPRQAADRGRQCGTDHRGDVHVHVRAEERPHEGAVCAHARAQARSPGSPGEGVERMTHDQRGECQSIVHSRSRDHREGARASGATSTPRSRW